MHRFLPPEVEGRIPTEEEMEFKAHNGRFYIDDVWAIVREFPSADCYECHTDLAGLVNALYTQIRDVGYKFVDSSDRLNDCHHALELTMAWAQVVRDARTTETMHILRRTPENCGAMLMLQRQEHLRHQCTEWAPVAYVALVRNQQIIVTRDRVMDQAATERMLIELARSPPDALPVKTTEHAVEAADEAADEATEAADEAAVAAETAQANMPTALFNQQIASIKAMLDAMAVTEKVCEECEEKVEDWESVESEEITELSSSHATKSPKEVECA